MKQHVRSILILSVVFAIFNLIGCGGSSTSPSSQPQIIQGSVSTDTFIADAKVVHFSTTKAGTLSSSVNWNNTNNNFDTYLLKGTCTIENLLSEASSCAYEDVIAEDESDNKPAVFTAAVSVGAYTLLIASPDAFADDTATYRIEVN